MNQRVLLVDDEPNVLQGYGRHLRRTHEITVAVGPAEALRIMGEQPSFAVVVSDMQMPEMSGIELFAKVRQQDEHTVRVMLTGNGDQRTAVEAVNEGSIFRFLNKPCPAEKLAETLNQALEHHRLITAEAELLSKTLSGSVRMLTQVLSLAMPDAFGLTQEARMLVRRTLEHWQSESEGDAESDQTIGPMWQIELAAMLMRLGFVSLPAELRARYLANETLTPKERSVIEESSQEGAELIAAIPRLQGVADLVRDQFAAPGKTTSIVSNALRLVGDFQRIRGTGSPLQAVRELENPNLYEPAIVSAISSVVRDLYQSQAVSVDQLAEGMLLDSDIVDSKGRMLVARGTEIHDSLIQRLMSVRRSGATIEEPIDVRVIDNATPTPTPATTRIAG